MTEGGIPQDRRNSPEVPLTTLVAGVEGLVPLDRQNPMIRGIAYHTRAVGPGNLFVCTRGSRDDGHRHAREAVARGAVAFVVERPLEGLDGVAQVQATDSRRALAIGIDRSVVAAGLENSKRIPGRFELVPNDRGLLIVVDFAHTLAAFAEVLPTLQRFTRERLITVFGCAGDRDRTHRAAIGRLVTELSDFAIVTTDNPGSEDPAEIAREARAGALAVDPRGEGHRVILDRRTAVEEALSLAREGDTVFLAGKGHEEYQLVDGRRIPYNDRRTAEEILRR